ncbi:MAG: hypothetical protein FWE09_03785 [Treponema sp.]|nr:hypothetical protein [Treponema sp.]
MKVKYIFRTSALIAAVLIAMIACVDPDPNTGGKTDPSLTGSVRIMRDGADVTGQTVASDDQLSVEASLVGTGDISYRWRRASSHAAAGTAAGSGANRTVTADDRSNLLIVTVTRAGHTGSLTAFVAVPDPNGPALTAPDGGIGVTGGASGDYETAIGTTLSVNAEGLGGNAESEVLYQWFRSNAPGSSLGRLGDHRLVAPIPGANAAAYAPTADDAGLYVFARMYRLANSGHVDSASVAIADRFYAPFTLPGGTVSISGSEESWKLGAQKVFLGAWWNVELDKIEIGSITADGHLSGVLPVPARSARKSIGELFPQGGTFELTISNPLALFFFDELVVHADNEYHSLSRNNSSKSENAGIYTTVDISVQFWFASHQTVISSPGEESDSEGDGYINKYSMAPFELSLQPGWNTLVTTDVTTESESNGITTSISNSSLSTTAPSDLKWIVYESSGAMSP